MSRNILRIPVDGAYRVFMRYNSLPRTGYFNPFAWSKTYLSDTNIGWFEIDFSTLHLADSSYEYEFVIEWDAYGNQSDPIPDPYANQITRYHD